MNSIWVWVGVLNYLLLSLSIAYISRSSVRQTMDEYFLASRSLGGILSALSYSATTYSAFMLVGLAGLTYRGGVGALGFELIYLSGMVLVVIFGPRFWMMGKKYGYVTPSEMLGDRYESRAVAVVMAVTSCLFLIPYSAVQLTGIGVLLEGMTKGAISFSTGALFATALAIALSLIAGMRSVASTDAIQAIVMVVSATLVVLFLVYSIGGFQAFFEQLHLRYPNSLTVPGNGFFQLSTFISLSLPWFFFSISNPQVSQRLFMPASLQQLRKMLLLFFLFGFLYTMVAILWGYSALLLFPDLPSPDLATPKLLASEEVPAVLGIIVMIGILAAAISTIDSILLTLSSLVAKDLLGEARDERRQVQVGKWVIPAIAMLAYLFAEMKFDFIAVLAVTSSAGLLVMVPAIVGAFFWRRGTAAGVLTSVIGSGCLVFYLEWTKTKWLGYGSAVWGLLLSLILYVGVSVFTKPATAKAEQFIDDLNQELKQRGVV